MTIGSGEPLHSVSFLGGCRNDRAQMKRCQTCNAMCENRSTLVPCPIWFRAHCMNFDEVTSDA